MTRILLGLGLACCWLAGSAHHLGAAGGGMTSAIHSETRGNYQRTRQKDGTYRPEHYALSWGGVIPGTVSDSSMEKLEVEKLTRVLQDHLERQNYFLAPNAAAADLLLVINWGRTIPFNDTTFATTVNAAGHAMQSYQQMQRMADQPGGVNTPASPDAILTGDEQKAMVGEQLESALVEIQMQNQDRRRASEKNARLLGYLNEVMDSDDIRRHAGGQTYFNDLVSDLEESRYYVFVTAYDFRQVVNNKKTPSPLWVTKISIRAQGNRFDEQLNEMVARMSRYFGRDSSGLIRKFEGTVEFGEAIVIGVEEETLPPERSTPEPEQGEDKGAEATPPGEPVESQ